MAADEQTLTEKEKQTLRLILRGHDAKSIAVTLGLSVHTINDRLRNARRKLQASSSREAARRLFEREGDDPEKLVGSELVAAATPPPVTSDAPRPEWTRPAGADVRSRWIIAGGAAMSIAFVILALAAAPQGTPATTPPHSAVATPDPNSAPAEAARSWLALHDTGQWREGYDAASSSFRKLNTFENWVAAAQQVRPPLGAVISRVLISEDDVPAPPDGVQVLKFRTGFANKPDALQTVALAWEEGSWKVTGIYIE